MIRLQGSNWQLHLIGFVGVALLAGCSGAQGEETATASSDQALEAEAFAAVPQLSFKPAPCAAEVRPGYMHCHAVVRTGANGDIEPLAAPQGLGPHDLVAAYKIPQGHSTATIAIVDAQDDPNAEADLAKYRSTFGLPPCTTANGCFKKVNQTGGTTYPTPDQGWAGEIMLDIEMASAACPSCKIILVEATSATTQDLGIAVNEAAALGATVISNSYGGPEDATDAASDTSYYNHPGIAIFASSGDSGFGVSYPAAGEHVIGVGGTTLVTTANSRGWSEKTWNGAGSGCSGFTHKPAWQTTSSCTNKVVADTSAVADPNTGVAVLDTYGSGGWAVYGGTSVASPLVASIFAASGLGKATGATVWSNSKDFNDVRSGNNGTCSPRVLCTAGAGWDGPTGLGTPIGSRLAKLHL